MRVRFSPRSFSVSWNDVERPAKKNGALRAVAKLVDAMRKCFDVTQKLSTIPVEGKTVPRLKLKRAGSNPVSPVKYYLRRNENDEKNKLG